MLTAAVVAVVGVAVVVGIGLWRGAGITATATSTPPLTSAESPLAPNGTESVDPDTLTGNGDGTVTFSVTPGRAAIATIVHEGAGPFGVWALAADGSDGDQLVDAVGPYAGTKLFSATSDTAAFRVEADGSWSIDVKPVTEGRTWNASGRLVGDGADVILVFPSTARDANLSAIHDGDGAFRIWAYASGSRRQLLDEVGALRREVVIPAGTSLLEIEADAAWAIGPEEP